MLPWLQRPSHVQAQGATGAEVAVLSGEVEHRGDAVDISGGCTWTVLQNLGCDVCALGTLRKVGLFPNAHSQAEVYNGSLDPLTRVVYADIICLYIHVYPSPSMDGLRDLAHLT